MSRTYVIRAVHPRAVHPSATLHIVASVRVPCPTCSRPPCLVRMLYEPFTPTVQLYGIYIVLFSETVSMAADRASQPA